MNIKSKIILIILLSLFIISCSERLTSYEIIGTTTTQQKLDNDVGTATAEAERAFSMDATRAAGGEVSLRPAEKAAATAQAEATAAAEKGEEINLDEISWRRRDVLKDFKFYMYLPLSLLMSFTVTGFLFHQVYISEIKSWTLINLAQGFIFYAVSGITGSIISGILIDKLTGRKIIPFHLLPMLAIFIVMLFSDHVYVLYLYMAVSITNNCSYCTHSHTTSAKKLGMTLEEHSEFLSIVGLAAKTNQIVNGLQVPIDEVFDEDAK